MKIYVILYKDGALGIFANLMPKAFQEGSKVFEIPASLPALEICEWQAKGYDHQFFRDVTPD